MEQKEPVKNTTPEQEQQEYEQPQTRLLDKPRKGILRLIFSRVPLFLILMVLQVAIFVGVFGLFKEYFPHYAAVQTVFTFIVTIYLFNCPMDSTGKLTWMVLIALFPFTGAFLLFYTQTNLGHRTHARRTAEMIRKSRDILDKDSVVLKHLKNDAEGSDDLVRYVNRTGSFPMYDDTEVTFFPLGEYKFEAMLPELEKAEKYIYLEYFIIEEGYMWGRILDILKRKAAAGVDVRVMYDGTCELSTLTFDYKNRLEKLGIRTKVFAPMTPVISTHYNYRDHRKILVIDGKVAFNGGVNLADEYINRVRKFGHWKDTALMLKGKAAESFTLMFLQMWNITEKNPEYDVLTQAGKESPADNAGSAADNTPQRDLGFVMPYGDIPYDSDKVGETVYMDILYRAAHYVHIMTPYLILDGELEAALCYAAQRGVDVKLILPGVPDKEYAWALAKSHYKELIKAGVKIYEYIPGFVHAKVFVSDDRRAVVGTINLDYRSLYHHFECATYLYRVPCIAEIEADFEDTLAKCRQIIPGSEEKEKLFYRVAGPLLKIIAPLM
ncbi:MAG: cardiolipin synthase [Clostridium sp.]|nr:cardiolipin synthase [Clostridium sp.]